MTNTTARSLSLALAFVALTALCLPPSTAAQSITAAMSASSLNKVTVNVVDTRTTGSPFFPVALPNTKQLTTGFAGFIINVEPENILPGVRMNPLLTISWILLPAPAPETVSFPFSLTDSQKDNFTLTITGTGGAVDVTCMPHCNVPVTFAVSTTCTSPSARTPSQTLCPDIKLSTTGPVIADQTATFTLHIDPATTAKRKK
jgi:hypothetical protein